jgi:hypothetical protein
VDESLLYDPDTREELFYIRRQYRIQSHRILTLSESIPPATNQDPIEYTAAGKDNITQLLLIFVYYDILEAVERFQWQEIPSTLELG